MLFYEFDLYETACTKYLALITLVDGELVFDV